jgi:hypothetical protein
MTTQTYTDEFEVDGGSATGGDYDLLPEGNYLLEIESLEPFDGTKFNSTEPQASVKVNYVVVADPINGDWAGEHVDQIAPLVKNMANPNANLHQIWKAATGETPQEGVTYKLKAGLVGRRVMGNVVHKANQRGNIWPRIASLSPVPQAQPRAKRGPAVAAAAPATDEADAMPDA